MSRTTTYGSIEGGESDTAFDLTDTYYLGEGETSAESRRTKCFSIGATLLVAVFIIGGAALFLSRDFGHLYPGSRGDTHYYDNHNYDKAESNDATVPDGPATTPIPRGDSSTSTDSHTSSKSKTQQFENSACSENEKCKERELLGECCPTSTGKFLDCC